MVGVTMPAELQLSLELSPDPRTFVRAAEVALLNVNVEDTYDNPEEWFLDHLWGEIDTLRPSGMT